MALVEHRQPQTLQPEESMSTIEERVEHGFNEPTGRMSMSILFHCSVNQIGYSM
ncbi:MAG: hypothetical protein JOY64_00615 [Alphaproteobacteria bacterium]|nr:hypothetical protein [Alphaproteobacteria bacterium]MBV8406106.1 hypothetical protein [Alphaproteobacteria bacterium]